MKTQGDKYVDYTGTTHDGRQVLVTVWDNGEAWVQLRDTSWDTWERPTRCTTIKSQP